MNIHEWFMKVHEFMNKFSPGIYKNAVVIISHVPDYRDSNNPCLMEKYDYNLWEYVLYNKQNNA